MCELSDKASRRDLIICSSGTSDGEWVVVNPGAKPLSFRVRPPNDGTKFSNDADFECFSKEVFGVGLVRLCPTRRVCGQLENALTKNGFVTPSITFAYRSSPDFAIDTPFSALCRRI
jgi:hypothetical protein